MSEDFDQLIYRLRSPCGIGAPSDHDAMEEAANHIEGLLSHIKLHAGDCLSLDNEVTLMRDHWQEAEARVKELEAECFKLSAGVCEHRSGNDHGNPLCLKTNTLI